jgi:hypothetical protein
LEGSSLAGASHAFLADMVSAQTYAKSGRLSRWSKGLILAGAGCGTERARWSRAACMGGGWQAILRACCFRALSLWLLWNFPTLRSVHMR